MEQQLLVRIGYEYPIRQRKHQVPCPHRQGVGMGLFAFQERVTPLARCNNTHDFVPKSCAKDAAPPLESPLTPPMGDVGSPHRREGLRKGAPRLFAARERYFCGNVITHYDTFSHAVCKV